MAFLDFLFGDTKKEKQQSTSSTQQQSEATKIGGSQTATAGETSSTTQNTSQQAGTQVGTTQQLSGVNLDILNQLIAQAASSPSVVGQGTKDAVGRQATLAQNALLDIQNRGANLDSEISARQEAARLGFAENQGAQISQFADQVGSTMNSTSQLLASKGSRDLQVLLAGLDAETRTANRQLDNQQLAIVAETLGKSVEGEKSIDEGQTQALKNALDALQVAKGAQSSSTDQVLSSSTSTQQTLQQQLMEELMREVSNITESGSSTTTSSGSASGGGTTGAAPSLISLLDILSR